MRVGKCSRDRRRGGLSLRQLGLHLCGELVDPDAWWDLNTLLGGSTVERVVAADACTQETLSIILKDGAVRRAHQFVTALQPWSLP